jgi:glycosyltransferase involved in cell wall biosynthesis
VVTDVGDVVDMVGNHGRVVPPGDMAALAAAAADLLLLPAPVRLQLSSSGQAHIRSHFDIDTVAGRYEAEYRVLAGR